MNIQLFHTLNWIWIAIAILLLPFLFRLTAPYGRHSSDRWGPMMDNRLAWFVMEIPALIFYLCFSWKAFSSSSNLYLLASLLYASHYIYRAIIFPLLLHTKSKKMPMTIALSAIAFNAVNGSLNGYWMGNYAEEFFNKLHDFDPILILGYILFFTGFAIHFYHDRILILLRKSGETGYSIPHGGLFNTVSCPNFLGEIIEWTGYLLICRSLPALAFLVWTCANLIPRALDHHRWYRSHFEDYPQDRKALIPGML